MKPNVRSGWFQRLFADNTTTESPEPTPKASQISSELTTTGPNISSTHRPENTSTTSTTGEPEEEEEEKKWMYDLRFLTPYLVLIYLSSFGITFIIHYIIYWGNV